MHGDSFITTRLARLRSGIDRFLSSRRAAREHENSHPLRRGSILVVLMATIVALSTPFSGVAWSAPFVAMLLGVAYWFNLSVNGSVRRAGNTFLFAADDLAAIRPRQAELASLNAALQAAAAAGDAAEFTAIAADAFMTKEALRVTFLYARTISLISTLKMVSTAGMVFGLYLEVVEAPLGLPRRTGIAVCLVSLLAGAGYLVLSLALQRRDSADRGTLRRRLVEFMRSKAAEFNVRELVN